jgi:hypothetical protein
MKKLNGEIIRSRKDALRHLKAGGKIVESPTSHLELHPNSEGSGLHRCFKTSRGWSWAAISDSDLKSRKFIALS